MLDANRLALQRHADVRVDIQPSDGENNDRSNPANDKSSARSQHRGGAIGVRTYLNTVLNVDKLEKKDRFSCLEKSRLSEIDCKQNCTIKPT